MNTELLLSDKRFRWISTMYYYVATNAEHTVTPFKNLVDFLEVKVADIWPGSEEARNAAQGRLSVELTECLQMRGFHIEESEIQNCLSDKEISNARLVHRLVGLAG